MPDECREGSDGSEQEAKLDIHSEDSNTILRRQAWDKGTQAPSMQEEMTANSPLRNYESQQLLFRLIFSFFN